MIADPNGADRQAERTSGSSRAGPGYIRPVPARRHGSVPFNLKDHVDVPTIDITRSPPPRTGRPAHDVPDFDWSQEALGADDMATRDDGPTAHGDDVRHDRCWTTWERDPLGARSRRLHGYGPLRARLETGQHAIVEISAGQARSTDLVSGTPPTAARWLDPTITPGLDPTSTR